MTPPAHPKAAAPDDEIRQHAVGQAVGQLADGAVANESARAVSPDPRAASASAARESAAAGAPPPASAPVQETLSVSPAPAAPAARTATFSALAFSPWRAVDGRVERSRDNGATWQHAVPSSIPGLLSWYTNVVASDSQFRVILGRTEAFPSPLNSRRLHWHELDIEVGGCN